MKVLISAIACDPYHGSEAYFGWSAVKALARDHELWVLTSRRQQENLTRAAAEGLVPEQVHFVYAGKTGPWHPNRMWARLQSWREYQDFSRAILPLARRLQSELQFDLAHHVTYATWRVASPLDQLGIPFIFGPVGGYEQFPATLFPMLSGPAAAFELARMASNVRSRYSPGVRRCLRGAAHVFAANPETERLAVELRGSAEGVSRLLPGFYPAESAAGFARFAAGKNLSGPLRLFAAGNMEGRKGVALALQALAVAKAAGVEFQYRLGAGGPEIGHLRALAGRLGLENEVTFGEGLQGEAYRRELGNTHVFLLPSLRESAGLTMMEAMLAGCVPVVADCGSPGFVVAEGCGHKIPVTGREAMVKALAAVLIALDRNRPLLAAQGRAASAHIAAEYSEDHYRRAVNQVYAAQRGCGPGRKPLSPIP